MGKGYLIAKLEIGRPADNRLLLGAQVNSRQTEALRIGVGINGSNSPDNDIIPTTPANLPPLDLNASHSQLLSQLSWEQANIQILPKPFQ
jgi:hypothetical protein